MNDSRSQAVLQYLAKILASDGFVNAGRMSRFLRFSVEAKLRGDQDQIKEYLIGKEVFDRGDQYDPRTDPIVRVEAGRLRTKLREYYAGPGSQDAIRIEFPKGSYSPTFEDAASLPQPVKPARSLRTVAACIFGILAILTVLWLFYGRNHNRDLIAVVPGHWLSQRDPDADPREEAVAEAITGELANSRAARVIAWPLITPYRTARKGFNTIGAELGASKVLMVSVRPAGANKRVTLFLLDAATGQKNWVTDFFRDSLDTLESQRELARAALAAFESQTAQTTNHL